MRKHILLVSIVYVLLGCQGKKPKEEVPQEKITIKHAQGFQVNVFDGYKVIEVLSPWPEATNTFKYLLIEDRKKAPKIDTYDAVVEIPVERIVVTSTTHIPTLEALGVEKNLVGFPDTKYISSEKTRNNIKNGKIKELGVNEGINTEILIDLQPDVVIGFSINDQNKSYETITKSGIPVIYNGDWTEKTPLGKAEWIKFFAPFFNAEHKADSIFNSIESEYIKTKKIAKKATSKPTVLSGALYKDIWYLPAGESWAAQFITDANADYLWKNSKGTGSLYLSFESVLEKGINANFWIGPAQFTSYEEMITANRHYDQFDAFNKKRVYTFSATRGETGGVLYYELAPNRPDIVLKDLVRILHPELFPEYNPFFFKPLK
ncbi:ABC transporter substrate-binding protein [Leptobacterium sp. I13]|uniref:ABC transporter substrate-binding protein n=1 Tax=Leptobacterium meishanense TaxID=3128904 RepID=UPI0030EF3A59